LYLWNVFAFPCSISAALTGMPSKLGLALHPARGSVFSFRVCGIPDLYVNKGAWCQGLLLGCKHPSVRRAVHGRKQFPGIVLVLPPQQESLHYAERTKDSSEFKPCSTAHWLGDWATDLNSLNCWVSILKMAWLKWFQENWMKLGTQVGKWMLCKSGFSPPLKTNGQWFLNPLLQKVMDSSAGEILKNLLFALPDSPVVKEPACNAGDLGSIPGSGRSAGEGIGYPLQYSCLENSMGSQRVGHDWATSTFFLFFTGRNWRGK